MTEVFFKLIPQILFEPIAVGALLGLFTALIFFWKKHGKFYWIVTVSIVFMLGWRLGHTDRIHSLCVAPDLSGGHFLCLFLLQTGRPLQADSEISGETQAHGPVAVPHRTLYRKPGEDASLQSLRKLYPFQLFHRKTGCREVRQASGSRPIRGKSGDTTTIRA